MLGDPVKRRVLSRLLVPVAVLGLAATACAPADDNKASSGSSSTPSASTSTSASTDACAKDQLKTVSAGKLTLATDKPVFEPWFVDDKPENAKGFEGAVAAAVAQKMGYQPSEVTWVRQPFSAAIQPGPKKWDFDINEFSITEDRKKAVDFSSPYYDVTQAVVTTAKSKAAKAASIADLKKLQLGAQVGTTSFNAIGSTIAPNKKARVYNTNDDALKALENGQIDALVTDLPTAFFMTGAQLKNGKLVGQLPQSGGTPEQFGLVLDKGSPITACVSKAVDALRADNTLTKISQQWLSLAGGAPVLK
jgi:polar amino acid transport system substrate-binding protein